jgi:hypothetical protein
MYKYKYNKYKTKYFKLLQENGSINPDNGDGQNEEVLENVPDDELEVNTIAESEFDEKLEEMTLSRKNFEGFDSDSGGDFISEDLQQEIFDIGIFGKIRGKTYDPSKFDSNQFTKLRYPSKNKILVLKDKDSFDSFTEKYGYINKKDKKLYIRWGKVSKKFKGVYIKSSVLNNREEDIPYMGRTVSNWINYDFNRLDEVVIFKPYRNLVSNRAISRPFKGHVTDEYGVDENEFSRISDPITNDKILLIDDIKSFDKFTVRYGYVKTVEKTNVIDIDWKKVKHDYDGLYIDKDNDFYDDRYNKAFYYDKLYNSWWSHNSIEQGVVYLFG